MFLALFPPSDCYSLTNIIKDKTIKPCPLLLKTIPSSAKTLVPESLKVSIYKTIQVKDHTHAVLSRIGISTP